MSSDTVSKDSSSFLKPTLTSIRTSSSSSSSSSRPSSSDSDKKNLRVLIVDDNFINLRTLSTLLNRRFSPFLAHPPVAVDSGLKAIQQMRSSVFDVVFMDIQMPFLSGLECTKRIRAGGDGILQSNSTANIVACTSCTGEAASASYRDTGFSGLIAKPVRFQEMSDFILPLSKEAFLAKSVVEMISPFQDGHFVFPPLPPSLLGNKRVFFDATKPPSPKGALLRSSSTLDEELLKVRNGQSSASAISNSEHFVLLLAAQTRASLKKSGAVTAARTGTVSGSTSNFSANHWRRKSGGLTGSSNELQNMGQFDKKVFAAQVAQEFEAANNYDSDGPSRKLSSSPSIHSDNASRPPCHHRLSSPAFLVESSDHDSSDSEDANEVPSTNRPTSPKDVKKESRPSVDTMPRRPEFKSRSRASTSNVFSSTSSPDGSSYRGWNHSSHSNSSYATTVDEGYEERQIYSSPLLTEFQKGFDQWKGLEGKTSDGIEDARDQEGQKFFPRQGSTSTMDDDESSCSTPDEEDDSRLESSSFDGSRTFSRKQSAKFTSIDSNQGLSALKGVFPS